MIKPLRSTIEVLEPRIAPANATMTGIVAGGTLKITAASNAIGANGALVQVGPSSYDLIDSGNPAIHFLGVKNIQITLSDASDNLDLSFFGPDRGSVTVKTGLGINDSVDFLGNGFLFGDVSVESKGANASVTFQGLQIFGDTKVVQTGASSIVGVGGALLGNLSVTGASTVSIQSGTIAGNAKITGPNTGLTATFGAPVYGDLTITGGTGPDNVTVSKRVEGKLRFAAGEGGSLFTGNQDFGVGGALNISGGLLSDTVNLTFNALDPFTTTVSGAATFALGAGQNSVAISGSGRIGGLLRVSGGDGIDGVSINGPVQVSGVTQLSLGGGNNTTNISSATFHGGLKYAGGSGGDFIQIQSTDVVGAASLALGDGFNAVNVFVSTLDNGIMIKGGVNDETIQFGGTTVYGKVNLLMGNGTNNVSVNFTQWRGGFAYTGGANNDILNIDSNSGLYGVGTVKGGLGSNAFFANTLGSLTSLTYTGDADSDFVVLSGAGGAIARVKIALGGGTDTATIQTTNFLSLKLDDGLGADTLNRIAALLSDDRIIKTVFETENTI